MMRDRLAVREIAMKAEEEVEMRNFLTARPAGNTKKRTILALVALGVLCLISAGLVALAPKKSDHTSAQSVVYAKLWPAFTMTYDLKETDPNTNKVIVDQTHKLVVTNERAWRDETTRDAVDPKEVGSYRELKNGVIHQVSPPPYFSQALTLSSPDAVAAITPELDPTLYGRIQSGAFPGWKDAVASVTGRIAKVHTDTYACALGGMCQEQRVVEFDSASINTAPSAGRQGPVGGIAVFGQRSVNGKVVYTFKADSLQIGG